MRVYLLPQPTDPPNVDVTPKQFTVNQTQSANFTCTSFGIPLPQLTWFKGNFSTPLGGGAYERSGPVAGGGRGGGEGGGVLETNSLIVSVETFSNSTGVSLIRSELFFPESLRTDQSSYTCVAINNITNVLRTPENGTTMFYVQGN